MDDQQHAIDKALQPLQIAITQLASATDLGDLRIGVRQLLTAAQQADDDLMELHLADIPKVSQSKGAPPR